jgi:hypothetical protein
MKIKTMKGGKMEKKKFYQTWWFWVIIGIIAISCINLIVPTTCPEVTKCEVCDVCPEVGVPKSLVKTMCTYTDSLVNLTNMQNDILTLYDISYYQPSFKNLDCSIYE